MIATITIFILVTVLAISIYGLFIGPAHGFHKQLTDKLSAQVAIGTYPDKHINVSALGFCIDAYEDGKIFEDGKILLFKGFGLMYHRKLNMFTYKVSHMFIIGPFIYFTK